MRCIISWLCCVLCRASVQMEVIRQSNPEQIAFIGTLSAGSDYNNRTMLKMTDLISFYFNGPLTIGPQGGVNVADERLMYQPVCPPPWHAHTPGPTQFLCWCMNGCSCGSDDRVHLMIVVTLPAAWAVFCETASRTLLCSELLLIVRLPGGRHQHKLDF